MSNSALKKLRFDDHQPALTSLYDEVITGLQQSPRSIQPKFFYDETGSRLFEAICDTPEYYLTQTEIAILSAHLDEIADCIGPDCLLIEPGSGSSHKVRVLLEAIRPHTYMPLDISGDYLLKVAQDLVVEYPDLRVHASCIDYTAPIDLPTYPKILRRVAFFPGSSIGNFHPDEAVAFLSNIAAMVQSDGGLLIGVDLKKDAAILNAAYNDSAGITADFNLNLLERINRELEADFDTDKFEHHAYYNQAKGRIEMHLVSQTRQQINIDDQQFRFTQGENIYTESSYKYTISEFQSLASRAGFEAVKVWTDPAQLFSVHYFRRANPGLMPIPVNSDLPTP